jgi:hypothetical protein
MAIMASINRRYKLVGWTLFFASLAVFLIYHISHGMPGPDMLIRLR